MLVTKQAGDYSQAIRAIALEYYYRRISFLTFRIRMASLIANGLTDAWTAGRNAAGKTGILGLSERSILLREISREIRFLGGFSRAIERLVREGGEVDSIRRRIELWGDAYVRVDQLSTAYNGPEARFRWDMGAAEHCATCRSLSGQVRSGKEWIQSGFWPKAWTLDCHQGCKCHLTQVGQ